MNMPKVHQDKRNTSLSFSSCRRCRLRKVRCDDGFPSCSSCTKANVECLNYDPCLKKDLPRDYVKTLHERLKSLELENESLKGAQSSNQGHIPKRPDINNHSTLEVKEDLFNSHSSTVDELTDVMGVVSFQLTSSTSKEELISEMQFLKLVFHSFQKNLHRTRNPQLKSLPNIFDIPATPMLVDVEAEGLLPQKDKAKNLIDIYFSVVNSIFPILHCVEFQESFESLYCGNNLKPCRDLYILYLVLAVGAGSAGTDEQFSIRENYLNIAKRWNHLVFQDMSIVQMMQVVLLYGQVSMCKPYPPGLTSSITLVISMVQQLGMHQENKKDDSYTKDMKRRLFWCTYLLDRYVNVNVGRPFMISEDYISTEYFSLIDDNYIHRGFDPMTCQDHSVSYKSVSLLYIEFFKVLTEIKLVLHSPKGASRRGLDELSLSNWKSNTLAQLEDLKSNITDELRTYGCCTEYLYLIYYQALSWIYRPSAITKKASVNDLKMLFSTGKEIIRYFRKLHIQKKITFRMLSVNTLFMGAMYYFYPIRVSREIQDTITQDEIECDMLILELVITSLRETCAISSFCLDLIKSIGEDVLMTIESRKKPYLQYQQNNVSNVEDLTLEENIKTFTANFFDINDFSSFSLFETFEDLPWDSYCEIP